MVLALHKVLLAERHIVTQIVETEFVVGSESDVAGVGTAAGIGIRLMLVNAIHTQSVELIERAHPFGVSFGKVVIHSHHVHSLACKSVQEHRQSRHECFSLTGGHLGNLSLMQNYTADELHVVMDHIPGDFVSAGHPAVVPYGLVRTAVFSLTYFNKITFCAEVAVEFRCFNNDFTVLSKPAGC